eukprot:9490548-Pyramimonas_sp.AAC.3
MRAATLSLYCHRVRRCRVSIVNASGAAESLSSTRAAVSLSSLRAVLPCLYRQRARTWQPPPHRSSLPRRFERWSDGCPGHRPPARPRDSPAQ